MVSVSTAPAPAPDDRPAFAPTGGPAYVALVAVFAPLLLISNIAATKGVGLGPLPGGFTIVTDGGFLLFPLAYVLGDVLSEIYGFRAARRAVLLGFAVSVLGAASFWAVMALPPADFYDGQSAFETVFRAFFQVLLASLAGYLVGQLLNAYVLVWMKRRTGGRHLWARLVGSSVVGEFFDTLVFCLIAAGAIGISATSDLVTYVAVGFVYKTAVEIVLLPVSYRLIAAVKRREPGYGPGGDR